MLALFCANLLVIQHLETLYLGGNHVRVVCERVWRNAQDCTLKQGLTTRSRGWLATGNPLEDIHKWSMQRSWIVMLAVALQDKKSRLAIQLAHNCTSFAVILHRIKKEKFLQKNVHKWQSLFYSFMLQRF